MYYLDILMNTARSFSVAINMKLLENLFYET
jgi:hypothetical protein